MKAHVGKGPKAAACLYISKDVLESARRMGLNLSRVAENALVEAVGRLSRPEQTSGTETRRGLWGRGRDLNPGARLHRPIGYQATSSRPLSMGSSAIL